jgi:hypothetical protein
VVALVDVVVVGKVRDGVSSLMLSPTSDDCFVPLPYGVAWFNTD